MRAREADAVGVLHPHRAPDFRDAGQVVAGARGIVSADVVGLAFEPDAEGLRPGLHECAGERAAGRQAAERQAAVDGEAAGGAEQHVDLALVQVAEVGVRQLVPDDGGELRVGLGQFDDGRLDDDLLAVGEGVDLVRRHVDDRNGAAHHRVDRHRAIGAVAADVGLERRRAVGGEPLVHPARGAGDRNEFAVQRRDLVAGDDAGLRGGRFRDHRDYRRPRPGQAQCLARIGAVAARQALRCRGMKADLRRLPAVAVGAVGGADAEGDAVDAMQLGVIGADVRQLLPALLGVDFVRRQLRQLRHRHGALRAHERARHQQGAPAPTQRTRPSARGQSASGHQPDQAEVAGGSSTTGWKRRRRRVGSDVAELHGNLDDFRPGRGTNENGPAEAGPSQRHTLRRLSASRCRPWRSPRSTS